MARELESGVFAGVFTVFAGISLLTACNEQQGTDVVSGVPIVVPDSPSSNLSGPHTVPQVGMSCEAGDPDHLCLALKYVVYTDTNGTPLVSQSAIASNLAAINMIWNACDVGFQVDEFLAPDPTSFGLSLNPAQSSELNQIRSLFDETGLLLVVTTGTWDRSGTLGNTSANAWTNMPGSYVMGVVMEQPVGAYPNIIAHELGHYLNLPHVSDVANVMNPVIYSNSTQLNASQCDAARSAVKYWWSKMIRS